MLLIVTIGLVLAGVVLLVVGFLTNSLGYIYAAIVCAAVAGVALIVFSRLTRRRATRLAMAGASGDPSFVDGRETARPDVGVAPPAPPDRDAQPARVPAAAGVGVANHARPGAGDGPTEGRDHAHVEPAPSQSEPTAAVTAERPVAAPGPDSASRREAPDGAPGDRSDDASDDEDVFGDWDDDLIFPIEDYDELQVSQILPLLDELEPDELEDVRDRERHGPHRDAVLQRIGALLGDPAASAGGPAPSAGASAPPAPPAPAATSPRGAPSATAPPARAWPAPSGAPAPAEAPARSEAPVPAGAPAPSGVPAPGAPPAPADSAPAEPTGEPIPGYATMRISDILSHLNGLSPDQLAAVEAQERAGSRRTIVLTRINKLRTQT